MNNNINSAYRLHKILSEAMSSSLNDQVINGWAKVFDFETDDKIELYKIVIDKISLIDTEFDIMLKSMNDTSLNEDRYIQSIRRLYSIITPDEFYRNWEKLRSKINENDLNILLICSELMKDEEELISEEDFQKINEELNHLLEFLEDENIDAKLKNFVGDQISIIKNSLANYKIQGVKAFQTSFYEANTVIIRDTEILKSEDGKINFTTLKKTWTVLMNISEKVSKVTNLIMNSSKLLEIGSKTIDS